MKLTSYYDGFGNDDYRVNTDKNHTHVCVCIMQGSFMWTTVNYRSTVYYISKPNLIDFPSRTLTKVDGAEDLFSRLTLFGDSPLSQPEAIIETRQPIRKKDLRRQAI